MSWTVRAILTNSLVLHSAAWSAIVMTGTHTEIYNPHNNPPVTSTSWNLSNGVSTYPSYAAIVFNGLIYVLGGYDADSHVTNVVKVFNPYINESSPGFPLPFPIWAHGIAKLKDGDGRDNSVIMCEGSYVDKWVATSNCSKSLDMIDWAEIQPLPKPIMWFGNAGMLTLNNQVFVFGGMRHGGYEKSDSVYMYDENRDIWVDKAPIPNATVEFGLVALTYTEGLLCGGLTDSGDERHEVSTADCFIYSALNDTWTSTFLLTKPRFFHSIVEFQGDLYCIGGQPGFTYDVEVLAGMCWKKNSGSNVNIDKNFELSCGWRLLPDNYSLVHGFNTPSLLIDTDHMPGERRAVPDILLVWMPPVVVCLGMIVLATFALSMACLLRRKLNLQIQVMEHFDQQRREHVRLKDIECSTRIVKTSTNFTTSSTS